MAPRGLTAIHGLSIGVGLARPRPV
jgi:hypothetical protein